MAYRKKTWAEKLAKEDGLPQVINVTPTDRAQWGGATLVVPQPCDIDPLMKQVPKGPGGERSRPAAN